MSINLAPTRDFGPDLPQAAQRALRDFEQRVINALREVTEKDIVLSFNRIETASEAVARFGEMLLIDADNTSTVTLPTPTPADRDRRVAIKNRASSGSVVTVRSGPNVTIEGAATDTLAVLRFYIAYQTDGENWWRLGCCDDGAPPV